LRSRNSRQILLAAAKSRRSRGSRATAGIGAQQRDNPS
jgi:hypothetical protein